MPENQEMAAPAEWCLTYSKHPVWSAVQTVRQQTPKTTHQKPATPPTPLQLQPLHLSLVCRLVLEYYLKCDWHQVYQHLMKNPLTQWLPPSQGWSTNLVGMQHLILWVYSCCHQPLGPIKDGQQPPSLELHPWPPPPTSTHSSYKHTNRPTAPNTISRQV